MKKLVYVFALIFSLTGWVSAQQRPLGTWETFMPYSSAVQVVQSADRIYCATPYSLYYVEKADGSIGTLSKSNGLSDADVRHIAYNDAMKTLVITYANSNIDLLVNGNTVYNLPDIKNAIITGSKNINDVIMIGDYAYLATDLGISVLDLTKMEISSNYIIGSTGQSTVVNSIASDGVNIFAATAEGMKSAALSNPNLQDYAFWTIYDPSSGLPTGAGSRVGQIGGHFYAVVNDTLFAFTGTNFIKARYDAGRTYESFTNTGGNLYAIQWVNGNYAKILRIQSDGTMSDTSLYPSIRAQQIAIDGSTTWIADNWAGLMKYNGLVYSEGIRPDGPPDNGVFRIAAADKKLYLAAGGTDPGYDQLNHNASGPVIYDHYKWKNFPLQYYGNISGCEDLIDVAIDNAGNKAYYASMEGGLVEVDLTNNTVTKYDTSNSPLRPFSGQQETRISALCVDHNGNLWMSNTGTLQSLAVKTPAGVWAKFTVPSDIFRVRKMIADSSGNIWMAGRSGNGNIIVYQPSQDDVTIPSNKFVNLTTATGSGGLPNTDVWSMTSDKEGNVWVGSDVGIATLYCTGSIFSSSGGVGCDATRIKVDQGGYIGYLFSTEIVQAIAVDGADRKWVGTTNGVWLISADGVTQLLHFDKTNSPLPTNSITDIAVDQSTGEVWIGTSDGLVSYQGDAIRGGDTKGQALVYPNPVKSDYTGPIAIKGLVDNAYVKITDIGGILVYQGRANGGQFIWNGQGYSGNKVSTGIYMVYADTDDGSQHSVAKIIFVK
jgi:hypothetical protein